MSLITEAEAVLAPLEEWGGQCHAASVQLVRSGVLGDCRVARGGCKGVGSQHSWVVLGDDCYAPNAIIIDPTLWSYDETVKGIWIGSARDGLHRPHGSGSIWAWGRPENCAPGDAMELKPRRPFSRAAQDFLRLLGPLDLKGWIILAHAPVEGWPAAEIIDAMLETPRLEHRVPIDIVGMVTDRNPNGLYLAEAA